MSRGSTFLLIIIEELPLDEREVDLERLAATSIGYNLLPVGSTRRERG